MHEADETHRQSSKHEQKLRWYVSNMRIYILCIA